LPLSFRRLFARRPREEEAGAGPRIAVVGDEQARGVAEAMRILATGARVRFIAKGDLGRGAITGFDHVFAQPHLPEPPRARLFPKVVFTAFHPDAVRIDGVPSPVGADHSAIALFGHRRGLNAEAIVRLYREDVFSRLGYLDAWDGAAAALVASGRAVGLDFADDLLRWARRGLFMHGIDRPRGFVLADIAARLLREAGLPVRRVPVEAYGPDPLVDGPVWPVYPALATLYGVPGSTMFKRGQRRGEPPVVLDLDAFVAESLALYRTRRPEALHCPRLVEWEASPEIQALF
jgi:hypothetical protein